MRLSDLEKTRFFANPIADAELSPDGRSVAFVDGFYNARFVQVVPLRGGPSRVLAAFPPGNGQQRPVALAWAPDSGEVAINTESNAGACDGCEVLYTVNADGSGLKAVTSDGVGRPFYSPDGKELAYCSFGYGGPYFEFFMQQQALVHHGEHYLGPTCGESWQARP